MHSQCVCSYGTVQVSLSLPLDVPPPSAKGLPNEELGKSLHLPQPLEVLVLLDPAVKLHKLCFMSIKETGHPIQGHCVVVAKFQLVVGGHSDQKWGGGGGGQETRTTYMHIGMALVVCML